MKRKVIFENAAVRVTLCERILVDGEVKKMSEPELEIFSKVGIVAGVSGGLIELPVRDVRGFVEGLTDAMKERGGWYSHG